MTAISEETAVATIEQVTVLTPEIYNQDGGIDKICEMIELEVAGFEPDLSTDTSRKEIASMAYKVAQSKTHLVKLGKELTKGWRDSTKAVNSQIKETEDRLNIVRDDIRKPLTEWEQKEEKRIKDVSLQLATIAAIGVIDFETTFDDMEQLLLVANSIVIDAELMQEKSGEAETMLAEVKTKLQVAMINKKKEIAQQEELEQLRADKVELERKQKEAEEAEEKRLQDEQDKIEAEEKARLEAIELEDNKKREEKAQAERDEQIRVEAVELAREESEQRERESIAKIEADKQAEIDRINAEHEKEKSDKLAEEKAEQDRLILEAENKRHREEDELNRIRITTEIAFCFENVGLDATSAKLAAEGVMDGKIRNVSVTF